MGGGVCILLLLCFGICYSENAQSVQSALTAQDKQRLVELLKNRDFDSLQTAFYVSRGLKALGDTSTVKKKACEYIKQHVPSVSELDNVFYATSVGRWFSCITPFKSFEQELKQSLSAEHSVTELYYTVTSLTNIGSKVNGKQLSVSSLVTLLEQEESITSYGQGFLIGAQLQDSNVEPLMELVEDVVAQADETPTSLYFEGGLITTSTLINGIFELGQMAGKRPTVSAQQATLFSNYILSVKHSECIKEVYYLLVAAETLANNKYTTPVGLIRVNKKPVANDNKNFEVRLVDVLGNNPSVNSIITLVKVTDANDKITAINKPFTANKDMIYYYQLYDVINKPGTYTVTVSTKPADTSTVPLLVNVEFRVTISISVIAANAEMVLLEKDQNVAVKTSSLQYPDVSKEVFSVDHHAIVRMTFKLLNKATKGVVTVHQTFVQLVSSSGDDIYFVATPNSDGVYMFELDVAESAKESFGSKSGTYTMNLIVGGASVNNPFSWKMGSLNLKFPEVAKTTVSEDDEYRYKAKPIIEHMFAVPEKRPPQVISMAFSILVIVPLLLLLPIWLVMGANLSKIGVSGPWALLFHSGLAGIFMLYYCFWTNLNMFQTLQYLSFLGVVTFIAGNRMLKRIAAKQ